MIYQANDSGPAEIVLDAAVELFGYDRDALASGSRVRPLPALRCIVVAVLCQEYSMDPVRAAVATGRNASAGLKYKKRHQANLDGSRRACGYSIAADQYTESFNALAKRIREIKHQEND